MGNITLTNSKNKNIFIAKYDTDGNVIWAKSSSGTAIGESSSISVGGEFVYITGYYYKYSYPDSSLIFDDISLPNPINESSDLFIVKYDLNGNVIWAKAAGGELNDHGVAIVADKKGNVYLSGTFIRHIFFDKILLGGGGDNQVFVVKYDMDGNVLWAKMAVGSTFGKHNITLDNNDNLYITGEFTSAKIVFGSFELINVHPFGGTNDIFIAKYDSNGNAVWAKSIGGESSEQGFDLVSDAQGNIYVTGMCQSPTITFGNLTLENSPLFIVKYNADGNALWVQQAKGWGQSNTIAIYNKNIYITGSFAGSTFSFGATNLVNSNANDEDIFIAKLGTSLTSVTEENTNLQIHLFPNPTKSTFHISGIEGENVNITIYSLTGEKIYESLLKDSRTIDLSGKAKGTYIYQFLKENQVLKTGKIVLE